MTDHSIPSDRPGRIKLGALLSSRPRVRNLILLLWLFSGALSILSGIAAVEFGWSGLPLELDHLTLHVTLYPPLILSMLWLFWFGFWWAALPTWLTTFVLAIHYDMPTAWALLFACSDPLGLALIALVYRALPEASELRNPANLALFVLISFAAAVLSSVGAFIWSYATHAPISELYRIWEGWWLGFFAQNLLIVLPLLLLATPWVRRRQQRSGLWLNRPDSRGGLRQTLVVGLMLVVTAMLFTWLSAHLTQSAIMTAAYSRDAYIWQPIARMVHDSLTALMSVLVILMVAMALFGIHLYGFWSHRVTLSRQQLISSNRQLSAEIHERELIQAELQQRYQMLNLMAELDARLHAAHSAQEVIAALSEYLPRQLPQMEGVLCRPAAQGGLEVLVHWGRFPLIGEQYAARLRLPTESEEWDQVALYDPDGARNIHRALPLRSDRQLIGVILLGPTPAQGASTDTVLQILSEHLSLVMTNLRLREQLMQDATHDPLTGLYNRRYLQNWLGPELTRCARHARPLSLMMIDIDHFKQLNDTYGHEAGDSALQAIARFLSQHTRESDIACRHGGEELILALPEASLTPALERARELLVGIRQLRLYSHADEPMPPLTVSIGVAAYPQHADTADTLIRAADRAMYRAKAQGRNRICTAD